MVISSDVKSTVSPTEAEDVPRVIGGLEVKVSTLEAEIDKVKNESNRWSKRIGLILGVLGGLIAIPKGVHDAWMVIHASPKTSVSWGKPITMKYDQPTSSLIFTFNLTATNDGSLSDHVDSASVEITLPQAQPIFLSEADVQISGTTIPFALAPNQSRDLVVSVQVSPKLAAMALQEPGSRVLDVSLILGSHKQALSQKYCIPPLDADDLQSILKSQPRRVLFAWCD